MPEANRKDYETRKAERESKLEERGRSLEKGKPMPLWWFGQRDPITRYTAWIAILTGGLVFVGVLQWASVQGQLGEMRAQRDMTVAQQRANMRYEKPNTHTIKDDGSLTSLGDQIAGWRVNPWWTNAGSTDARNVKDTWILVPQPLKRNESGQPVTECPPFPPIPQNEFPTVVAPGQPLTMYDKILSVGDAAAAQRGQKLIYIVGRIQYDDIFPGTKTHHFDYCVLMTPMDIPKNVFSYALWGEYAD